LERGSLKATQTCWNVILEFLADYADGTLDLESPQTLEEHLRACGACMAYLLRRFMLERMTRKAP